MEKIEILNVGITNASKSRILEYIMSLVKKKEGKCIIVTPNPEIIIYAQKHQDFRKILNEATIALPDGIGLTLAGKLLNTPLSERITGTDMMEMLCSLASKHAITVGFLGAKGKIAEKAAKCLQEQYDGLIVLLAESGEQSGDTAVELSKRLKKGISPLQLAETDALDRYNMISSDNKSHAKVFDHIDLLFVAFGFPKQEEWMHSYLASIPVSVAIGVGGAFDYISKSVPRAPKFIRDMGFEWLFRLLAQPWRIRRQVALIEFLY